MQVSPDLYDVLPLRLAKRTCYNSRRCIRFLLVLQHYGGLHLLGRGLWVIVSLDLNVKIA